MSGNYLSFIAPEPVGYPMAAGERVVLGWLADEKASHWQVGSRRSHPLDQRPVQGSGVYMVKPRTHDEPEGAPTEHLVLQRHPKGQPDVPEHRGERVARFVLELGVPLPLENRKKECAHYPAAVGAVLGGVLNGLARAPVVRLELVSEHIGGIAIQDLRNVQPHSLRKRRCGGPNQARVHEDASAPLPLQHVSREAGQ